MPRRGTLSWAKTRMERADDRRPSVREEPLRSTATAAIAITAWRGLSGRRYVFAVFTLAQAQGREAPGSVILGVRRDAEGNAVIVGAGHRGTIAAAIGLAWADGADEIHVHRLAETEAEREAIVEDLLGDDAI